MMKSYILISLFLLSCFTTTLLSSPLDSSSSNSNSSHNHNNSDSSSSSNSNEPCRVYIDIKSNYTGNSCGKSLDQACLNMYQALQACGPAGFDPNTDTIDFNVTVLINDGVYTDKKDFDIYLAPSNNTVVFQAINQGAVTFDMQGQGKPFVFINDGGDQASSINFTLQGVAINNGDFQSTGNTVIFSDRKYSSAIINIYDCVFENHQGINGTVLYTYSTSEQNPSQATVTISRSVFNNNVAQLGASIYFHSLENLLVSNCTFDNNNASNVGVIYQLSSTITIIDSAFTSCYTQAGGLIYFFNQATLAVITNTQFNQNSGGGLRTGCLYIVGGEIINSVFSNNYNLSGILFYNDYISTENTVSGCTFVNNTNGFYHGGGIFIKRSIIHLNNTVFLNNTAINGGGIYFSPTSNNNTSTFYNVTFSLNTAYNEGGGFLANNTFITLEDTVMTGNDAAVGSSIFCQSSTIDIYTSSFSVNSFTQDSSTKGISCGVGQTCRISGDQSYYSDYCSSNWTPVKPGRILTSGQIAGIIIGCLAGVFIICTIIVIIIKKVSRKGYHSI
ncbi:hypothetical protein CYY_007067 [Polysphondylium violaceum]|uniref:Right handed beta helix domain-containing protein n=1 Tax=Polysphondylium violaceum TaxID=133409 RepID=A0A8J4PQ40_9MYCE|nr:hypothetical protein CYY_007067 [Polysphondylium violaceum]